MTSSIKKDLIATHDHPKELPRALIHQHLARIHSQDLSKKDSWQQDSTVYETYITVEGYLTLSMHPQGSQVTYYKQWRDDEEQPERYFDSYSHIEYFQNSSGAWVSYAIAEFEIVHRSQHALFDYIANQKNTFADPSLGPHLFDHPIKQKEWDDRMQQERLHPKPATWLDTLGKALLLSAAFSSLYPSFLWSSTAEKPINTQVSIIPNAHTTSLVAQGAILASAAAFIPGSRTISKVALFAGTFASILPQVSSFGIEPFTMVALQVPDNHCLKASDGSTIWCTKLHAKVRHIWTCGVHYYPEDDCLIGNILQKTRYRHYDLPIILEAQNPIPLKCKEFIVICSRATLYAKVQADTAIVVTTGNGPSVPSCSFGFGSEDDPRCYLGSQNQNYALILPGGHIGTIYNPIHKSKPGDFVITKALWPVDSNTTPELSATQVYLLSLASNGQLYNDGILHGKQVLAIDFEAVVGGPLSAMLGGSGIPRYLIEQRLDALRAYFSKKSLT